MASTKKTPDYLNLPFEVHFSSIAITTYELMYDPEHPPKWMEDYPAIECLQGTSYDTVFVCSDNSHGELKAVLVAGIFDEYVPRWLAIDSENDVNMKYGEKLTFTIREGEMHLGERIEDDENLEYEDAVPTPSFYGNCGSKPDFIVLDADNTRVCIDSQAYELDEDGKRVSDKPLFDLKSDEMFEYDVTSFEYRDTMIELGTFF